MNIRANWISARKRLIWANNEIGRKKLEAKKCW